MRFTTAQWLAWLGSTLVAAVALSAFAFQNFETKTDAQEKKTDVIRHLDRIEAKVDRLIEKR